MGASASVEFDPLPMSPSQVKETIPATVKDFEEFKKVIDTFGTLRRLEGYETAIQMYETLKKDADPSWSFYEKVYPSIVRFATAEGDSRFTLLRACKASSSPSVETGNVSRQKCLTVIANAVLGNIQNFTEGTRERKFGGLSLEAISGRRHTKVAPQRLLCFWDLFDQAAGWSDETLKEEIEVTRGWSRLADSSLKLPSAVQLPHGSSEIQWTSLDIPLVPVEAKRGGEEAVVVHEGAMEDAPPGAFVDFANMQLHIGCVIPSATQEEVLFSACPELFCSLINVERLEDNEVVVFRNVKRVCAYKGYAESFQYDGKYEGPRMIEEVLAIDACECDHFTQYNVLRDLGKAALGFGLCEEKDISSGAWGCGIFGGDRHFKFIQQLCAARATGKRVHFSSFRNAEMKTDLQDILARLGRLGVTVGCACEWLLECEAASVGQEGGPSFREFLLQKIVAMESN
uniref:PARG catalytic Macro domain-containing protein n=1 Tax=Chromera velia CCMP2878 TaxID=1169474 RepID=A0A0G4HPC5_9ALVE|eukprot:Cvel_7757.t1-p1 / transcript=Cvel_7757.t1 / gene=Cvel_7757 / organism=Chromera_velia_CCMP2878 / gene_product=Poly(ADP-ribose) glycohydrolase, putative / transcript_product=Poly(ADP-ribose) glycohydrolase, putative / location=Cvel_scaffold413:38026-43250(+) / protein_length=457 / sequence_SO=supercontig / SO=protein_coding / is_pseudo=false